MNPKIDEMIKNYKEPRDFYGPVTESQILRVETELKLKIPNEYKKFILKYGSGGICGQDINGIEGELGSSLLESTLRNRNLGLSEEYLVVFDAGEYIMCLKASDSDKTVYSWDKGEKKLNFRYASFDDFIEDYFQEAIDNY